MGCDPGRRMRADDQLSRGPASTPRLELEEGWTVEETAGAVVSQSMAAIMTERLQLRHVPGASGLAGFLQRPSISRATAFVSVPDWF